MTNPNTGKVPLTVYVDPPPEGMEWFTSHTDTYQEGRYKVAGFQLRPIVPATVMVEMTREDWEDIFSNIPLCHDSSESRLRDSIFAALARKPYPQFDHVKHVDPTLAPDEIKVDGEVYKLKLPCPVMVCRMNGLTLFVICNKYEECSTEWPGEHRDRRPCKLSEGHGGEHE